MTLVAELPELAGEAVDELELRAFRGTVLPAVPGADTLARAVDTELDRPYHARAVRQDDRRWAVAARAARSELVRLSTPAEAASVEVVRAPDGEERSFVDGTELLDEDVRLADAVAELERRGGERFQAFVARADRLGEGLWEVTIDPL